MVRKRTESLTREIASMESAIRNACSTNIGGIDQELLCVNVASLNLPEPLRVNEYEQVEEVMTLLQTNNTGCALVTEERGTLCGIFSERDYLTKLFGQGQEELKRPISEYMTPDPLTVTADCTLAYALNIMSHGGFRHVPVMDNTGVPISLLSQRDVGDFLVQRFTEDIMSLEIEE